MSRDALKMTLCKLRAACDGRLKLYVPVHKANNAPCSFVDSLETDTDEGLLDARHVLSHIWHNVVGRCSQVSRVGMPEDVFV